MTRIVRYDPFHNLRRMFWDDFPLVNNISDDFDNLLKVDMYEEGENLILETDLPGVKKEDVKVELMSDNVTIRTSHEEKTEEKNRQYTYQERRSGSYARTVNFPVQIQADKVNAEFKDGMLKLTMPKMVEVKPETVKVEIK